MKAERCLSILNDHERRAADQKEKRVVSTIDELNHGTSHVFGLLGIGCWPLRMEAPHYLEAIQYATEVLTRYGS